MYFLTSSYVCIVYIVCFVCLWQERPYHSDSTASRLLSEVKHCRARLVLRWGTTLESLVLFFCSFLQYCITSFALPCLLPCYLLFFIITTALPNIQYISSPFFCLAFTFPLQSWWLPTYPFLVAATVASLEQYVLAALRLLEGRQFLNTARDIKRQWNWYISTDK